MKKISIRIISLSLALIHLFTICFRDIGYAAESSKLQKLSAKVTKEELIGYDKKGPSGITGQEMQRVQTLSAGGQESFSPEKAIKNFYLDPFSGAVNLSIPLFTPPGRKGVQPSLSLTYSSRNANGPFGWGWRMDFLGYIERSTKNGVPKYDSTDKFIYNINGVSDDLISIGGDGYRSKTEGNFQKFSFDGKSWVVKDKQGNTYYLGRDNQQPGPGWKPFRWYLDAIKDCNGNEIAVNFTGGSLTIPSYMYYTLHLNVAEKSDLNPKYYVMFKYAWDTGSERRKDIYSNSRSGWNYSEADELIKEIVIWPCLPPWSKDDVPAEPFVRKYIFDYSYSKITGRSFLAKITEVAADGTIMPPITFTYQGNPEANYEIISFLGDPTKGDNLWNIRVNDTAQDIYFNMHNSSGTNKWLYPHWNYLGWGPIFTQASGSDLGLNWSINSSGDFSINSPAWREFYAWTYAYLQNGRNLDVSCSGNANHAVYLNADYTKPIRDTNISLPLKAGYNLLEITGYNENSFSFNLNANIAGDVDVMDSQQVIVPSLSGDFNGDGVDDLGTFFVSTGTCKISLSNGNTFLPKQTWIENFGVNQRLLLGDFNGDGKTDVCAFDSSTGNWNFALSDGTKFVKDGIWISDFGKNTMVATGNFNGDEKTDICLFIKDGFNSRYTKAQFAFNQGRGFEKKDIFTLGDPFDIPFTGDINADGLTDLIGFKPASGEWFGFVNEGNGKFDDFPCFYEFNFGKNERPLVLDFNGDGATDIGYYDYSRGKFIVEFPVIWWLSYGKKELSFNFTLRDVDIQLQTGDYNADGIQDLCAYNSQGNVEIALSRGNIPDLLSKVENGTGGVLELQYNAYSQFSDITGNLPFVLPVLLKSIVLDSQGNSYVTNYSYSGGHYDTTDREFRGFAYTRIIDAEGNFTESYFKQDDIYKGRLYKQEVKDKNGKLYSKTENIWQHTEPYPGVYFPFLAQTDNYIYDGDASYKQARTKFEYDVYGNPRKVISEGDVVAIGDEKTQITEYTYNTANWLLAFPKHTYLLDQNQSKVSEKWLYYDDHSNIDDPPVKGLLTKEEIWRYDPIGQTAERFSTTYAYDEYGNLTSLTDPLGRATNVIYDSVLHTYPATTTNALGHTVKTTYDAKIGKPLTITDPNNQTTTKVYDSLGRLIKIIGPNDTADYPGVIYDYDLSVYPAKVTKRVKVTYASPPEYLTYYSFYDGLSRLIQAKSPAENDPQTNQPRQVVSGIATFDHRGQVKEKYLPYFVNPSADYVTPTYNTPHTTFAYDSLGRLVQNTNPDMTYSSINYSDWTKTIFDENGHYKTEHYDAYGRIAKIEEHKDSQTFVTAYKYDSSGNLIKLTDDKSNVTQIWYDSLGRKIKMDDPDMGVWAYEYDKAGNLLKQTDAKGQILTFNYDSLNRLTGKLTNGQTVATYQYDDSSKNNCKGRLSKVTDQSGSTEFFYDNLGRELKSIKTVTGSGSYSIERSYDALNRLLTLKYPDAGVVEYKYNPQGIEKISCLSPTAYDIIGNIDYSPTGQITKVKYGNGAETNYSYNPNTLRLTNLTTRSSQGKIQDLNYQFDKVGNILNIADYVNTASQAFLYDDLNRLIQAIGSYGTFTYDYDAIGNMIYKEGVNLAYGKNGRLPHAVTQFGSILLDYDANGNMVKKANLELTYDAENHLTKAEDKSIAQPPQPQTQTITLILSPGWNFISLPIIPQDSKISSVLSAIAGKYDQVSRYDSATKQFENYCGNPKYDQFSTFEYGKGYQIYITGSADVTLILTGTIPATSQSISLKTGYNLIFTPRAIDTNIEIALLPLRLDVDYSKVFYYNKSLKQFQEYSSAKKEFTTLKPGISYYLNVLKDITWTIANDITPTTTTTFAYDGDGGRVKKADSSGASTTYIGPFYEVESSGVIRKHIFAGANRVCAVESTGNRYFYHSDHLGSSNVITNAAGNQVQLTEFTPYGATFKNQGNDVTKHKFTGKELDKSTGLYFYGARYYNPNLAHFITPDSISQAPFDPQSLNRYSYCRNNPLIYTDPTGHSFLEEVGNFFSAIGSFIGGVFSAIGGFFSGIWGGAFGKGGSSGGGSSGGSSGGGLSLPGASREGSGPSSSEVSNSFISGAWNLGSSIGNALGSVFRTATFNLSGVVGDWAGENWDRASESRKSISPYASNFTGVEEAAAISALPGLTELVFGVAAILFTKAAPAIGRAFDSLVVHFARGKRSPEKNPTSQRGIDSLRRQEANTNKSLQPKQVPPDKDPTPVPIDPTNRRAPFSDPDAEYGPPWDDTMWRDAFKNY